MVCFVTVTTALEDLTGCTTELIFLSAASQGVSRLALWDKLLLYRRNGFILGAGTGAATLADKNFQDLGMLAQSNYVLLDVRVNDPPISSYLTIFSLTLRSSLLYVASVLFCSVLSVLLCSSRQFVDGLRLLHLRRPPAAAGEVFKNWAGDFSAQSSLWTPRLRHKLGVSPSSSSFLQSAERQNRSVTQVQDQDEDDDPDDRGQGQGQVDRDRDTSFWMTLDDFCDMFRYLVVCRWYGKKWRNAVLPSVWKNRTYKGYSV